MTQGTYDVPIPESYLPLRATIERVTTQSWDTETWTEVYTDVPCRKGMAKGGLLLGREQVSGAQEIENFIFNRLFNGNVLDIKPEDRIVVGSATYRVSHDNEDVESAEHHLTIRVEYWDAAGDL